MLLHVGMLVVLAAVAGFENIALRVAPPALLEPNASWTADSYSAAAAAAMAKDDLVDHAVLFLHRAATLAQDAGETKDAARHWLSFCRTLISLASSNPPCLCAQQTSNPRCMHGTQVPDFPSPL